MLAEDCEEEAAKNLITALAREHSVDLLRVPSRADLGELAGLVKYDMDHAVKKTIGTSAVAVTVVPECVTEFQKLLGKK